MLSGSSNLDVFILDTTGLTAPTSLTDNAHQVSIETGQSSGDKVIVQGIGPTINQTDTYWGNITTNGGKANKIEFALRNYRPLSQGDWAKIVDSRVLNNEYATGDRQTFGLPSVSALETSASDTATSKCTSNST